MYSSLVISGCKSSAGVGWCSRTLAAALLVVSLDTFAVGLGGGMPLYDAQSGVLPSESPWTWDYFALGGAATSNQVSGGSLQFATDEGTYAGYNLYGGANLDSNPGFTLDFSLKLFSESHSSTNRSGFSIIALNQEASGVELSFWSDQVWAKNADTPFSHGESISVDTTVDRTYRLTVFANNYSFTTDGAPTLTGVLRNYEPFAPPPFDSLVYGQQHYIFFGDNTGSAAASVGLSAINLAPVPEPGEWALMLAGLGCVAAAIRRRRPCVVRRYRASVMHYVARPSPPSPLPRGEGSVVSALVCHPMRKYQ